jgi:hypothetical protein
MSTRDEKLAGIIKAARKWAADAVGATDRHRSIVGEGTHVVAARTAAGYAKDLLTDALAILETPVKAPEVFVPESSAFEIEFDKKEKNEQNKAPKHDLPANEEVKCVMRIYDEKGEKLWYDEYATINIDIEADIYQRLDNLEKAVSCDEEGIHRLEDKLDAVNQRLDAIDRWGEDRAEERFALQRRRIDSLEDLVNNHPRTHEGTHPVANAIEGLREQLALSLQDLAGNL